MHLPDDSETSVEINIVPMIDVIFAILAFFVISTLYLTSSEGLPVDLPTAKTAELQRTEQINVTISSNGAIAINTQPIQLSQLQESVRSRVNPNTGTLVVVNADRSITHGWVVSVMDQLRQVEGIRLAIAAEKP